MTAAAAIDEDRTASVGPGWAVTVGSTDGVIAAVTAGADASWADSVVTSDAFAALVWRASHGQAERHDCCQ